MARRWTAAPILLVLAACVTSSSNMFRGMSPADLPGFPQNYDRVFNAALTAATVLSWQVTLAERDAGVISAITPLNLATYGDKVTIRVFPLDSTGPDSLIRVGFTSSTEQAIDWGQNERNQKAFFRQLRDLLKDST